MAYFSPAFIRFFSELAQHNDRDWFVGQKKTYESEVKNPFTRLVEDLIRAIRDKYEPAMMIQAKDAIFRINRDIRFSSDKSPYKLHVSALVSTQGRKTRVGGLYIQFGAEEVWIGGGAYEVDKEGIEDMRYYIANQPQEFRKVITEPDFVRLFGALKGEENKRLPPALSEAAAASPEIWKKQWYFMATYKPEDVIYREDLLDFILEHYRAAQGVNRMLQEVIRG